MYSTTWNTASVADGNYTLYAVSQDVNGHNWATTTESVTVDNTPPQVSITVPSNNAALNNTIALTATSTDNNGVVGVTFYYATSTTITAIGSEITSTSSPNAYTTTWNTFPVLDGQYTLSAVARDAAGSHATSSISITTLNLVTGLAGFWRFNEGSGGSVADSSGNSNTGSTGCSPTWATFINADINFGNGTCGYMSVSTQNGTLDATSSLTISAWINLVAATTQNIVNKGYYENGSNEKGYDFRVGSNGKLVLQLSNDNNGSQADTGSSSLNLNTWYHVAGVFNGSTVSFYINGVLDSSQSSGSMTTLAQASTTALMMSGSSDGTGKIHGQLDEVRVYTRALTGTQISALYTQELASVSTVPPALTNLFPATTTLASGITKTTLSVMTNNPSTCKYGTSPGVAYDSMANTFSTTGNLVHYQALTGLTTGTTYNYYVRCKDTTGNKNTVLLELPGDFPLAGVRGPEGRQRSF